MISEQTPKIYESPDKGKTVYVRDFGSNPMTRKLVKSYDGPKLPPTRRKVQNCS